MDEKAFETFEKNTTRKILRRPFNLENILNEFTLDFDTKFVRLYISGSYEHPLYNEEVRSKETGDIISTVQNYDPKWFKEIFTKYNKDFDKYYYNQ